MHRAGLCQLNLLFAAGNIRTIRRIFEEFHFLGCMGNGTPLPVALAHPKTTGKRVHLPMPPKS
jgi:hypothetical protein